MRKKTEKNNAAIKLLKAAIIILSAIYCLFMPFMTGLGLLYNHEAYGTELSLAGILFMVSALLMAVSAVMCLSIKKLPNILSLVFSSSGAVICLLMLKKLCTHADSSGWSDKFTMEQVSHMYERRILPCILPVILIIVLSLLHLGHKHEAEEYTSIL